MFFELETFLATPILIGLTSRAELLLYLYVSESTISLTFFVRQKKKTKANPLHQRSSPRRRKNVLGDRKACFRIDQLGHKA